MVNKRHKPAPIDIEKSITKAKLRPGFTQAWNSLEVEYAALEVLLSARKMAGLTQEELADRMIVKSNRVYEVLTHKRSMTIEMIRKLHCGLVIPVQSLIKEAVQSRALQMASGWR